LRCSIGVAASARRLRPSASKGDEIEDFDTIRRFAIRLFSAPHFSGIDIPFRKISRRFSRTSCF
jgi:hypothetical protein